MKPNLYVYCYPSEEPNGLCSGYQFIDGELQYVSYVAAEVKALTIEEADTLVVAGTAMNPQKLVCIINP